MAAVFVLLMIKKQFRIFWCNLIRENTVSDLKWINELFKGDNSRISLFYWFLCRLLFAVKPSCYNLTPANFINVGIVRTAWNKNTSVWKAWVVDSSKRENNVHQMLSYNLFKIYSSTLFYCFHLSIVLNTLLLEFKKYYFTAILQFFSFFFFFRKVKHLHRNLFLGQSFS